jgi:hypothetical protein
MCIGIFLAVLLNNGIRLVIYLQVGNELGYDLGWKAVIFGVFLFGFLVPIIANLGPSRHALSKNLRTSLDL